MDRLDWDLGLLHLTFQISYFFLLLLVFLIYKTDIVTSLVNYIEICMENCDRILSISVIVLDIAIIIRRVKTVLCRSDIRIFSDFFFFLLTQQSFLLMQHHLSLANDSILRMSPPLTGCSCVPLR